MNADVIREKLRNFPFEPFEIIISSGERHAVMYSECLLVLQTTVALGDLFSDRLITLAIRHVTELRPIVPQAAK